MTSEPQLTPPAEPRERNWLPLAIAAVVIVAVGVVLLLVYSRSAGAPRAVPPDSPLDPYASNLRISNLAMSRSSNYIGAQITYVDGQIVNTGNRTVTGITAQVLFRDYTNIITQNTAEKMQFIRTRTPYIDVQPVSTAPLKPGAKQDFRLVFDGVSPDWNGAFPEIRIVHVETR
ncbi:MAG TPA: DUF2393 family protein [Terracidiphilus sp.]|nr:DUF2393 family protein [Terracidiphilus sp.]